MNALKPVILSALVASPFAALTLRDLEEATWEHRVDLANAVLALQTEGLVWVEKLWLKRKPLLLTRIVMKFLLPRPAAQRSRAERRAVLLKGAGQPAPRCYY